MKKRLLMIVLGLVLVNTGMVEGAPNPWKHIYPNLAPTMQGTWKEASMFSLSGQNGGQFNEWILQLSIINQDSNGNFYGVLYGLPTDNEVYLSGSIDINKAVTMAMLPGFVSDVTGATYQMVLFNGKLYGNNTGMQLSGTLTLIQTEDVPFTKTGKIVFTVLQD
jgi:hypothetical protein